MSEMISIKLPEWTNELPDHSSIDLREVARIFGVSESCIRNWIRRNRFPKPDFRAGQNLIYKFFRPKMFWKIGSLRRYEIEQHTCKE